jgi:hypothetical protein
MAQLAAYALAILLLIFVITVHLPTYSDAGSMEMKNLALTNLLKDAALAAFAMHIGSNAKTVG